MSHPDSDQNNAAAESETHFESPAEPDLPPADTSPHKQTVAPNDTDAAPVRDTALTDEGTIMEGAVPDVPSDPDATNGPETIADAVAGKTVVPDSVSETIVESGDVQATVAEPPPSATLSEDQFPSWNQSTQLRRSVSVAPTSEGGPPQNPPTLDGDRYELTGFHARGGIGEVWCAADMRLGRPVALKSLRRGRERMRERFILEAELTGRLEHPGVVPVYDLALDKLDKPYYVMKFVRGRSMKAAIRTHFNTPAEDADPSARQLEFQRFLDAFVSLCETIGYAHEQGIIHRDIKPENVMLGEFGETLVLDWGLAKDKSGPDEKPVHLSDIPLSSTGTETRAGSIMGSPAYMAPELVEGNAHSADERTDIYLLGASLYEVLTGKPPHHSDSVTGMLERARQSKPDPPRELNPNAPKPLCAIAGKAMERSREGRYESAMEIAQDVRRYIAREPVSAYQESYYERSLRWARTHQKQIVGAAAAAVFLIMLSVGWSLRSENQQLAAIEQARSDVIQFQNFADEARYFAATSDRLDQNTPYYNPTLAQQAADNAFAISADWGDRLQHLPLDDSRDAVRASLQSLLLVTVQSRSSVADSESVEQLRSLLDQADALGGAASASGRLRAALTSEDGSDDEATTEPQTALDHFLVAEAMRRRASRGGDIDGDEWAAHRELIERAVTGYRAAIRLQSDDFWSYFQLGRCLLSLGRNAEGVETLGACIALRPESPWPYSARGLALATLERYEEALADLNHAIELDDGFQPALLNRGVTYLLSGNHDAALQQFNALLQYSKPQLVEAAYYRAVLQSEAGDLTAAISDLEIVLSARPEFAPARLLRCRIHYFHGEFVAARKDADVFLAGDTAYEPDSARACYERARFIRRLLSSPAPAGLHVNRTGLLELALSELQESVNEGGDWAELYAEIGSVLELLGAFPDSFAAYSKSIEIEPVNDTLLVKRGWLQALRLNEGAGAIADFEAALQANPENAEAHSAHGFLLAIADPSVAAERAALRAVLHGAGDYLILHNVACIFAELATRSPDRAADYEQSALDVLSRGIQLWQKGDRSGPDASQLAANEPSFRELSKRPEFQQLIQ